MSKLDSQSAVKFAILLHFEKLRSRWTQPADWKLARAKSIWTWKSYRQEKTFWRRGFKVLGRESLNLELLSCLLGFKTRTFTEWNRNDVAKGNFFASVKKSFFLLPSYKLTLPKIGVEKVWSMVSTAECTTFLSHFSSCKTLLYATKKFKTNYFEFYASSTTKTIDIKSQILKLMIKI